MLNCRILLTSTSEVYGDPLEHPQTEAYWGNVNPIGMPIHLLTNMYIMLPFLNPCRVILICFIYLFSSSGVRSCYDEGKRVAETLMFDYHRQHGVGNNLIFLP
jgi:UDP-glucuronate decarboxylase